jgi:hypothetical protein
MLVTENFKPIAAYLAQCRVVSLHESQETHVPPTAEETIRLIRYLREFGVRPLVIGSVGVLSYLNVDPKKGFRPTVDLDLWVDRLPDPPEGWTHDPEAINVSSWISPSGGRVDFLLPNQFLSPGVSTPARLDANAETADTDFPVASWISILKLKLNSVREKDLSDSIALVRSQKRVPTPKELGRLNSTQRENYDLVRQWFQLRPHGNYGE